MNALTLNRINALSESEFTEQFGDLFEHSPWVATVTWSKRPFTDSKQLHENFCQSLRAATPAQQMDLICAHPDLVGKAARAGQLTNASTQEQSAAGLSQLTSEEIAAFDHWNKSYQEKFGFPFIICARLNKKEAILNGFQTRINHCRDEEISAALGEIEKIAWFRLADKIAP